MILSAGEDYTLKLWKTSDGMIDEHSQRFLEEDLTDLPRHISTFAKSPSKFLVLYSDNEAVVYDSQEHYPKSLTFSAPDHSSFIMHNEFNNQFAVLHENNISLFSANGNLINKFKFQSFYNFACFVKIFHYVFIGECFW